MFPRLPSFEHLSYGVLSVLGERGSTPNCLDLGRYRHYQSEKLGIGATYCVQTPEGTGGGEGG